MYVLVENKLLTYLLEHSYTFPAWPQVVPDQSMDTFFSLCHGLIYRLHYSEETPWKLCVLQVLLHLSFHFRRISFPRILIYKYWNTTPLYFVIVYKQLSKWLHRDGLTWESSAPLEKKTKKTRVDIRTWRRTKWLDSYDDVTSAKVDPPLCISPWTNYMYFTHFDE